MNTVTNTQLATKHNVGWGYDELFGALEIPVVTGVPQCQGDVMILPAALLTDPRPLGVEDTSKYQVKPAGVVILRGDGGHAHMLFANEGTVTYLPGSRLSDYSGTQGVLLVAEGSTALLIHEEHGSNLVGPGEYEIRQQREQADEIRAVND